MPSTNQATPVRAGSHPTPEGFYRRAYPLLTVYLALSALICVGLWTHAPRPLLFTIFTLWSLALVAQVANLIAGLPATRTAKPPRGDRTATRVG